MNSEERTSNIFHATMRSFLLQSAGSLPKSDSLIRRQRQIELVDEYTMIPAVLKKAEQEEDFVFYEDKRLIIFTTERSLRYVNIDL